MAWKMMPFEKVARWQGYDLASREHAWFKLFADLQWLSMWTKAQIIMPTLMFTVTSKPVHLDTGHSFTEFTVTATGTVAIPTVDAPATQEGEHDDRPA